MSRIGGPLSTALARRYGETLSLLRRRGRRLLGRAADVVFPPCCAHCDQRLSAGSMLCDECRTAFIDARPQCEKCGVALAGAPAFPIACMQCAKRRFQFERVICLGEYRGVLREAVLAMKRPPGQPLAKALAQLLCARRHEALLGARADAVVPVPMHWTRRAWRGASSAETLARNIAEVLQRPYVDHLLRRLRATAPQAPLSPPLRRKNVRGAFRAARHADLAGARVLLVDDVLTTGATCQEAARALKAAGAAAVVVAVVGRGIGS